MDIVELILHDHQEQRRMFGLLDDVGGDREALAAIWRRLAILLDVHAAAEEQLFYPRLLHVGEGADGEGPREETTDAVSDHNDIRDAVDRSRGHQVGSDEWWSAVADARHANSDHMGEEERGPLADFRRSSDLKERHDLGVAFATFEAAHADGVRTKDRDPQTYVERVGG